MIYCTLDDIKTQVQESTLIELTDDTLTGNIDIAVIEAAVIFSETLIDGYLRGRYTLPLTSVPAVVKILCVDLTISRLYSRRFHAEVPDGISEKYKNSVKILEQIQKGIISLGIEITGTPPELGEYRTNKSYQDRIFPDSLLNTY